LIQQVAKRSHLHYVGRCEQVAGFGGKFETKKKLMKLSLNPSDWTDLIGKMKVCDDVDAKHLSPIKQNHQLAVRPEMFADTPVRVISARD
jgi:hypothetical protein